ncbi:hypothetical protein Pdw03_4079 [Penicillium digitatum]|nr:hypothetical protein Pdw03_4079 [Penicillium digitatum]
MEIWHKSADTLNDSKDRCHQSAKLMLRRSVSKWNQSVDQLHRVARIEETTQHVPTSYGRTQEQTNPKVRFYSRALNLQSTNSSPNPQTTSFFTKVKSIKSASVTTPSMNPEEQIKEFEEAIISFNSRVKQTRQLRDDKRTVLGDIELEWVNSTITDAENAATDLVALVKQFKQISPQDRSSWKRRNYEVALRTESRMLHSHDKVETVFNHLGSLPSTLGRDTAFFSPSEVSKDALEIPYETSVTSVFELPCSSPVKVERPIPKIIVTQHYGEYDDNKACSHSDKTPSPRYGASGMNSTA